MKLKRLQNLISLFTLFILLIFSSLLFLCHSPRHYYSSKTFPDKAAKPGLSEVLPSQLRMNAPRVLMEEAQNKTRNHFKL